MFDNNAQYNTPVEINSSTYHRTSFAVWRWLHTDESYPPFITLHLYFHLLYYKFIHFFEPMDSHPPRLTLIIIFLLLLLQTHSQLYDPSQQKGEKSLLQSKCNSSTVIYFSFNPTSSLTCSQSSGDCSVVAYLLSSQEPNPTTLLT